MTAQPAPRTPELEELVAASAHAASTSDALETASLAYSSALGAHTAAGERLEAARAAYVSSVEADPSTVVTPRDGTVVE